MPRWLWIVIALCALALYWAAGRTGTPGPASVGLDGAPVACPTMPRPERFGVPLQLPLPAGTAAFRRDEFAIEPLAGFSLEARVLGREDYRFDAGAALSPTDLALGWQRMADPAVFGRLDISQGRRWYYYRWDADGPPLPVPEIIRSSANMHLVPADASVAAALDAVRPGDVVRLQGWLVEARRDDGWRWRSSTSREDSGDGACELIYVCELSAGR